MEKLFQSKAIRILVHFVLQYFVVFNSVAQIDEFINYTSTQGLITDETYNLYQDSNGYINVFTKIGTQKTNGISFEKSISNLSLEESFIFAMNEDFNGVKYFINSNANFYFLRNDSAIKVHGLKSMSESLRNNVSEVYNIVFKDSNTIYIVAKGNTYIINKNGSAYTYKNLSFTNQYDSILIKLTSINRCIVPVQNRFQNDDYILRELKPQLYLKNIDNRLFKLPPLPYFYSIRNFKYYGKKNVFFTYAENICLIDSSSEIKYVKLKNVILSTSIDSKGNIWIGCLNGGLYKFDSAFNLIKHYLPNTTINSILIDANENLYCSTNHSGIYKLRLHDKNRGLSKFRSSIVFIKEVDKKLFVALENGELFVKTGDVFKILRKADGNVPLSLLQSSNKMYLTTSSSIEVYSRDFTRCLSVEQSEKIYSIYKQGQDTLLHIWRRGYKVFVKDKIFRQVDFEIKVNSTIYVNRHLFLATSNGIYKVPIDFTLQDYSENNTILPNRIALTKRQLIDSTLNSNVSIVHNFSDKEGYFLTLSGDLYEFSLESNLVHMVAHGLPAEILNNFAIDSASNIYFASNKGVFRSILSNSISGHSLLFQGEVKELTVHDGNLFFNSREVLLMRKIDTYNEPITRKYFNLKSILIDDHSYDGKSMLSNIYSTSLIKLSFEVLNQSLAKNPILFYTLTSSNVSSGFINDNLLILSHLKPGSYDLNIYAFDNGLQLKPISIQFEVIPQIYETTTFKFVLVILIATLLIILIKIGFGYSRRKERKRQNSEQLLLEYKLIALKAQINPHFMSNCLTAIQSLIISKRVDEANFYIAQFGLLVRKILNYSSLKLITLKDEIEMIELYIELEKLRFNNKFDFSIVVNDKDNWDILLVPPLLLNPLVENAVWHGISPIVDQKQCYISIRIEVESDRLVIYVEDNGLGYNIIKDKKDHPLSHSGSKGVSLTEQRLLNLNYLTKKEIASLSIKNRSEMDPNTSGTSAKIVLPLEYKI